MADEAPYSAFVPAAELAFPRGGRWVFFLWEAILIFVLRWGAQLPNNSTFAAGAALLLAAGFLTWTFSTQGSLAFRADADGITVAGHQLPWDHVAGLRISPKRRGALLEVVLGPAVQVSHGSAARRVANLAFMAFVPFTYMLRPAFRERFCPPAVRQMRLDPPRFQVSLPRVSPEDLQSGLVRQAPGTSIVLASMPIG
jgi:hypothetical protein